MEGMKWTREDIDFLEESWGSLSIPAIAKKLKRTENAIRIKAVKLSLGRHIHSGTFITFNQFIKALGYNSQSPCLKRRLEAEGFPFEYKKTLKKKYTVVDLNKFWKWCNKNKHSLNFSKFEEGNLGEEPTWVKEKRKADKLDPGKINRNRLWTKDEKNKLIFMCKQQKYTYSDISQELNRTEAAIKRRVSDMKLMDRPLYRDNHIKWTEEEIKSLINLYKKGYDSYSIAKKLNKSELGIRDRIPALKMQGVL